VRTKLKLAPVAAGRDRMARSRTTLYHWSASPPASTDDVRLNRCAKPIRRSHWNVSGCGCGVAVGSPGCLVAAGASWEARGSL